MKLPMPLQCGCGEKFTLEIVGSVPPEYAQCPKCHSSGYVFEPLGNLVTKLLMERARRELVQNDSTICMLLSAVAVEAEMAYLFFKWKAIDAKSCPPNKHLKSGNPGRTSGQTCGRLVSDWMNYLDS